MTGLPRFGGGGGQAAATTKSGYWPDAEHRFSIISDFDDPDDDLRFLINLGLTFSASPKNLAPVFGLTHKIKFVLKNDIGIACASEVDVARSWAKLGNE